jgi:hypothetical protein
MCLRKQVVIFGVIVGAIAGLGLTLTTLHNAIIMVASAVWGY